MARISQFEGVCNAILCRCQQTTEPMSEGPKVKGHLIITVAEASGKNKDDQLVWDPNFVEGFVKGESTIAMSIGTAGFAYGHVLIGFSDCAVEIRGEKGQKVKVSTSTGRNECETPACMHETA